MKLILSVAAISLFILIASPPQGESVWGKVQRIKPECLNK